ncbi:hypothetical protein M728_004081 (plasmid) [Ensifer sp. WSM1721]
MHRNDREKKNYDHDLLVISASTISGVLFIGAALLLLIV